VRGRGRGGAEAGVGDGGEGCAGGGGVGVGVGGVGCEVWDVGEGSAAGVFEAGEEDAGCGGVWSGFCFGLLEGGVEQSVAVDELEGGRFGVEVEGVGVVFEEWGGGDGGFEVGEVAAVVGVVVAEVAFVFDFFEFGAGFPVPELVVAHHGVVGSPVGVPPVPGHAHHGFSFFVVDAFEVGGDEVAEAGDEGFAFFVGVKGRRGDAEAEEDGRDEGGVLGSRGRTFRVRGAVGSAVGLENLLVVDL